MNPASPDGVEDKRGPTLGRVAKPRFFYGYIVTAAGFSSFIIGATITSTFGVFFKPMLTEFGWTRAETVLAYSLLFIVHAVLGIVVGWLSDKIGPRIVVTVFGSFLGICYLLMSQVNAAWQFQLNYALLGAIGLSSFTVPIMSTVTRWFVRRRGMMIGIVQAGTGIGGLIFAPLAGWLILTSGWRSSYIILGIIVLVGIITSGLFLRRAPEEIGQLPDGATEVISSERDRQSSNLQAGLSVRGAMRTSQFWMIAGLYFSFGFCRSTFLAHIAAHVQDLGFSLTDGANVLAVLTGASIIGRISMGRVADMIDNGPAFMVSYAAMTLILIWGLITEGLWGLFLFALVFGFSWGAQAVLRFAITSEAFGLVSLGAIMGVLTFAEASASGFGSYFAGYLFDVLHSYQPAFITSTALSAIGILLAWRLKLTVRERKITREKLENDTR